MIRTIVENVFLGIGIIFLIKYNILLIFKLMTFRKKFKRIKSLEFIFEYSRSQMRVLSLSTKKHSPDNVIE